MVRIIVLALLALASSPLRRKPRPGPTAPVRIVVPSPPAGGTDIVARVMAEHFSKAFKQQFFVENRPGAGNMIGIESVARAANDGYTFLMTASTLSLNSVLYKKVSYDPIKDFAPITLAAKAPNVLIVNPSVPAKTLTEFIALAKKQPGKLTYGTPGIGTSPHMCMELFKSLAGVDLQHIPYRGTVPALTDVMSGQITCHVLDRALGQAADRGRQGARVRRVDRHAQRLDAGHPLDRGGRRARLRGRAVVRLPRAGRHAGRDPRADPCRVDEGAELGRDEGEARARRRRAGAHTPEEFAAHIRNEIEKWRKVAKAAGIEPQ